MSAKSLRLVRSALFPLALAAAVALAVVLGETGTRTGALAQQGQGSGSVETAVFAGGCFWCVEEAFDKVDGVVETTSGYTGGDVPNPTYKQVTYEDTGHAEAVQVKYDPAKVSYEQLLDTYWRNVDIFDGGGQFCDRGHSYRPFVFAAGEAQMDAARQDKAELAERFKREIAVEIEPLKIFYAAEDYHQDYHTKNALKYKFYKWNCGRAQRLEEIWGKPES